jgi:hypothetical protein
VYVQAMLLSEVEKSQEIRESMSEGNADFPQTASVLSDWKLIGRYLGKSVRTVQRWERELGLPVRRTHDGIKSAVIAVPAEIDDWVQARKFHVGETGSSKSERMMLLLQSLRDLRAENQKLRRQLEAERARRQ